MPNHAQQFMAQRSHDGNDSTPSALFLYYAVTQLAPLHQHHLQDPEGSMRSGLTGVVCVCTLVNL